MLLEIKSQILEMIALGVDLAPTIEELCRLVDSAVPEVTCSVHLVPVGHLVPLAAPSLQTEFVEALAGLSSRPTTSGLEAIGWAGKLDGSTDEEKELWWRHYVAAASPFGFKACWFEPIKAGNKTAAAFAFHYRSDRSPNPQEREVMKTCVHLATIAFERTERVQERQRLAYTDPLTGLPNRARFTELLAAFESGTVARWSLLILDLDNLKLVNDTFGHTAGDDLIKIVGERLTDAATPHTTFRLGGDEFAVVIGHDNADDLAKMAGNLLAAIKQPAACAGHQVLPSATIGGAISEAAQATSETRQKADIALYHAKERNRGGYAAYREDLGSILIKRFQAIRDVTAALHEDRLLPYYQPIVRLDTLEVVGFEALCRMTTQSGSIVPAAEFHEATKDAQVAAELTQCMLVKVSKDVRHWLEMGLPFQHVGVNLSAADFHTGTLQQRLCTIFREAGVPLQHIILEVTESVYLGRKDHAISDEIEQLRATGMRVALDDFGTGFASLTHLLTVPVDIIKIDKSFIDRLIPNDPGAAIVEGLLNIAHKLGIRVVAEGIETVEQLEQLRQLRCSLGQGYFFSKPLDWDTATELLRDRGQRRDLDSV
jgi:diguanylate cyclase (GGDEF)-like protein